MKSEIAQTSKGPVEYTLLGNGPVVLACHGTSSDCFSTDLAKPLVESGFSVTDALTPGLWAHAAGGRTSAARAAEALAALLDSLDMKTCSAIAISGGGPTGITLAAGYPERVGRLVLAAAISRPEERPNEPNYNRQAAFYGPMHSVMWGMLGLVSRLSPRGMARQTLVLFSTHDPDDGLSKLSAEDIQNISRFLPRSFFTQGSAGGCPAYGWKRAVASYRPTGAGGAQPRRRPPCRSAMRSGRWRISPRQSCAKGGSPGTSSGSAPTSHTSTKG